jgi:hypothetical protein
LSTGGDLTCTQGEKIMKKLFSLTLFFCLTLLLAGNTLAAPGPGFPRGIYYPSKELQNPFPYPSIIDSQLGNTPQFEGWYSVEKETPSVRVFGPMQGTFDKYGLNYFQNDQTYAKLKYTDIQSTYGITSFEGSYLFDNHCFLGMEYADFLDNSATALAPGYRFNLGDDAGYVAMTLNYLLNMDADDDDYAFYKKTHGVIDYEIKARYYTENSQAYGQLVFPDKDTVGTDEHYLRAGGAYKVNENLVIGADFTDYLDRYKSYEIGCTATLDKVGAELRFIEFNYDNNDNSHLVDANLLYSFTNQIRAGLELFKAKDVDGLNKLAKIKYTVNDQNSVVFMHQLPNDDAHIRATSYLYWDIKLM